MPRALAIETSGRIGSIALAEDGVVLVEDQFAHGLQHAAEMVPRIDRLCRQQGWTPRDIAELYVSAGPGSFTGLRIGVTLAKTLAFATAARIVAVPTVRVLADNAPPEATNLTIVLDAKRDQVFTARFARENGQWVEREPSHLDTLVALVGRSPRPVFLLGEGVPHHQKFVAEDDPSIVITPPEAWRARAAAVAVEGARLARLGHFVEPDSLIPIYIRKPEAEEKWEQRQG